MLFSVGYQLRNDHALIDAIINNRDKIGEIYFAWDDFANGRNRENINGEFNRYTAEEKRRADLGTLSHNGLSLNLLLNANCYGGDALSRKFFYKIGDTLEYLYRHYSLSCVTTTSPVIAKFVKQNFAEIETRASVNMGIGSPEAIDYIADVFDSFYLKRELNRDLKAAKKVRDYCNSLGKKLYGLANSGCLNNCSAHTFHDNLVAHEDEISARDNAYDFEGQCFTYLKNDEKRKNWLRITNFIRPEDIPLYSGIFDGVKLATRVNTNPVKIINAYCRGKYSGAVSDILEPNHSGLFYPEIIENSLLPEDFAQKVLSCSKSCARCNYCNRAQAEATVVL